MVWFLNSNKFECGLLGKLFYLRIWNIFNINAFRKHVGLYIIVHQGETPPHYFGPGPSEWPARCPNLIPLDFFSQVYRELRGYAKIFEGYFIAKPSVPRTCCSDIFLFFPSFNKDCYLLFCYLLSLTTCYNCIQLRVVPELYFSSEVTLNTRVKQLTYLVCLWNYIETNVIPERIDGTENQVTFG